MSGTVDGPDPLPEIAVVGIGCRFPGAANLTEYWRVLSNGENHIITVPPDRWAEKDFYDKDPDAVGKSYVNMAGFIPRFTDFDNKLFGISETEALQMDPQQRQVLECTYMALENAGITREQISGKKVGVYIGSMNTDCNMLTVSLVENVDQYSVAGLATSVISNRVSYQFNLTGPSMTIDTACSSSLVAIHQAILGIRGGDCSHAICGGINFIAHPQVFNSLCKARMLSPTGQCHTFSNDADGYTRGEGCGIVVLKPLKQAISDGDNIWGTICTGLNQDGHFAQPITAPSQQQQEDLLKEVFSRHQINPSSVQYIEAHGTGTKRGDPVEIGAFSSFFLKHGSPRQRYIGSAKTNIGHLEPAAGVAGLIKVLLMMKHEVIVPSLNFDKPNELIDFKSCHFEVPTENVSWKDERKFACLNSFGFGGANSHAVVAHTIGSQESVSEPHGDFVVCFSGNSPHTLEASMVDFIKHCNESDIRLCSYTSTVCREHFKYRKAWVVDSIESLKTLMMEHTSLESTSISKIRFENVVFVFCGMGTTWAGMCRDLMLCNDNFREVIELIDKSLNRFVSWSLSQRIEESFSPDDPIFGPIAVFSCQVALARLWKSVGVSPSNVVGQSIGEVAAAHVCGILSLDEAVKVIYHRTTIMSQATGGKMLLVRKMRTCEVETLCQRFKEKANISLYYSPVACSVSGDCDAIDALKSEIVALGNAEVQLIELNVTSAFHSHHMLTCQQELDVVLQDLKTEPGAITMISSVDASLCNEEIMSPEYWGRNVRQPVRFHDAIKTASNVGKTVFIEIGPKPVLKAHLKDIFEASIPLPPSLPSMVEQSSDESMLRSAAFLYENSFNIEWVSLVRPFLSGYQFPRYAFDHKRIWKFKTLTSEAVKSSTGSNGHLFVRKGEENTECNILIRPTTFSTVYEHKVKGIIVVPGTTYAETGFGIANAIGFGNPMECAVSVSFLSPVTLKKGQQCELLVETSQTREHEATYTIRQENNVNATGKLVKSNHFKTDDRIDLEQIRERCIKHVPGKEVYQMLALTGFTYGESFATISEAYRGREESLSVLKLSHQLEEEMKQTVMHPAILDGMLQAAAVTHFEEGGFFPTELLDVTCQQPLQKEMVVYSKLTERTETTTSFFLSLLKHDGTILGKIRKFSIKFIGKTTLDVKNVNYRKIWSFFDFSPSLENVKTAVFTNLKLDITEKLWIVVNLDTIETEDGARQLPNCLHNVSQVCFIYEQSISEVVGENLLHELFKRLKSLRLVLLQHVKQNMNVPIYVVMETRESDDCFGEETANCCLNEATSSFCRCIRKEYKALDLKTVEIFSLHTKDFATKIPTAIGILSSSAAVDLIDVKYKEDKAFTWQIVHDFRNTPDYRTSKHVNGAVLCSALPKSVVDPSFIFLEKSGQTESKEKHEVEFLVTSAVTHTQSLYWVTGQSQSFGSSEAKSYPLLSLEFKGKRKIKSLYEDSLACFPSEIKETISIPVKCTIPLKQFPGYQPGFLLKIYTLFCMCRSTDTKHVTILHSKDTEKLAMTLRVMLKSMGEKEVLLLTPNDWKYEGCLTTFLLTIQLTSDLTQQLIEKTNTYITVVSLANLVNHTSLGTLSSSQRINIKLLHQSELFSPNCMIKQVPKMFEWIRSNLHDISHLLPLIENPCQTQNETNPIKLSEMLNTREISIKDGISLDKMKTAKKHLVHSSLSYLVIGGLTGLGWECVVYLAKKGAGSVIIMGRRALTAERRDAIQELRKSTDCFIQYEQGDVTNVNSLKHVLSAIHHFSKPLAGIIFSAAVLHDASLAAMTNAELKTPLLPKICGAWNVHMLTKYLKLDIFLLHSSVASVFGNAGQSNYGAGNGFLDALALKRQECGLSGQSVNWGPLALGLLEDNIAVTRKLQAQGYNLLSRSDIPVCLTHLLMLNESEPILFKMDLRKVTEHLVANKEKALIMCFHQVLKPFLRKAQDGENSSHKESFNIELIRQSNTDAANHMLLQYVKNLVCDKAMLDEDIFDMDEELKGLGVDSMYAIEISSEILSDCGVKLSLQEIQLQSARTLVTVISEGIVGNRMAATNSSQGQQLISQQIILRSIVESFFGFDTSMKFDPSFVLICTVKVPQNANTERVCDILKTCLSFHSLARSTCHFSKDSYSQTVLTVEEAFDFQAISGQNLSEVEALKAKPINLQTHGPLRFIFLSEVKELIIVFHKFFFDIKASTLFVSDILKIADPKLTKSEHDKDKDILVEIQKEVSPQMERLETFWKSAIMDIPYSSFSFKSELAQSNETNVLVSAMINKEIYQNILKIAKDQNLSLFEYLISIYQLLLACMSKHWESTVTTSIDLRGHIPALHQSLGRCTNLVPLIYRSGQESQTVNDFLKDNKSQLNQFIKNGLFPFEEMKSIVGEGRVGNLNRNFFIFEDDTFTTESNNLKVEQNVRFAGSTETILFMWHKRKTKSLEMKFHLVGSRFTLINGKQILKAFIDLLRVVTGNPSVPLRSIRQSSLVN